VIQMALKDGSLRLTAQVVANAFADPAWATKFPPVLSVDQVAALLQVPKLTVYDWRSRGLLQGCSRKVGKHLRFFRDKLLLMVFNDGLNTHGH
jgi:excisionase family DNA binding protein